MARQAPTEVRQDGNMDDDECVAEFIDGSWTTDMCGCEDCRQVEYERTEG